MLTAFHNGITNQNQNAITNADGIKKNKMRMMTSFFDHLKREAREGFPNELKRFRIYDFIEVIAYRWFNLAANRADFPVTFAIDHVVYCRIFLSRP